MAMSDYERALAAGLNRRDAGLYAFAQDLRSWARETIEREERFAASIGTTRAEILKLPPVARSIVNQQYLSWCAS